MCDESIVPALTHKWHEGHFIDLTGHLDKEPRLTMRTSWPFQLASCLLVPCDVDICCKAGIIDFMHRHVSIRQEGFAIAVFSDFKCLAPFNLLSADASKALPGVDSNLTAVEGQFPAKLSHISSILEFW